MAILEGGRKVHGYTKPVSRNKTLISIITVVFNSPVLLEKTIQSVQEQTYDNYEHIIVDGASNDGHTLDVIKKYDQAIDYWISEKDSGIYNAMNKGLRLASEGSYLNFLNAGDTFLNKNSLSKIIANISNSIDLFYCDIYLLQDKKDSVFVRAKDFTLANLLRFGTGVLCHQAMFLKKEKALQYDDRYRYKAELNWYFDIVEQENLYWHHVNIVGINYSTGGFGYKNFLKNRLEWLKIVKKRYGFRAIIMNDLIIYLIDNMQYKYSFIKKIRLMIRPIHLLNNLLKKLL